MQKWIQIWYSWGDQESAVSVPQKYDPWNYMMGLAIEEACVAFTEHEDEGEIGFQFYEDRGEITLHYPGDDTYCYYKITDTEDFDPWEEAGQ